MRPLVYLSLVLLTSCTSVSTTRSGPRFSSRGENCDFELFSAAPGNDLIEIATLDLSSNMSEGFSNLGDLKRKIAPSVCEVGGDVALAVANGVGNYRTVTVFKRTPSPATRASAGPENVPAGCAYDTQCKGERICVKGGCVDPPSKTPTGAL